jgi:hypothetical protein
MATVTFTYDHSRDPMHPGDLSDKIATALGIQPPTVDINPTQIIATGAGVTEANRAAIQAVIGAYVIDPVRAKAASAEEARLRSQYATMRQWAADARTATAAWDAQTTAQRFATTKVMLDRFGKLCDGMADLLKHDRLDT